MKKTSRRRSVGALNLNNPMLKWQRGGSYLLGGKINNAISEATGGKVDEKILANRTGRSRFVAFDLKKSKATNFKAIGRRLASAGVKQGLFSFRCFIRFSKRTSLSRLSRCTGYFRL